MHPVDIFIAVLILAAIVGGVYLVKHHKPPATPSGADLANALAASANDAWEAVKRDLPEIVDARVAKLQTDLAAALKRAQQAEADLAATIAQHAADKAAVAARVAAAVTASPELPPSPVVPAVAAAQAADAARVEAFAAQITPTLSVS